MFHLRRFPENSLGIRRPEDRRRSDKPNYMDHKCLLLYSHRRWSLHKLLGKWRLRGTFLLGKRGIGCLKHLSTLRSWRDKSHKYLMPYWRIFLMGRLLDKWFLPGILILSNLGTLLLVVLCKYHTLSGTHHRCWWLCLRIFLLDK